MIKNVERGRGDGWAQCYHKGFQEQGEESDLEGRRADESRGQSEATSSRGMQLKETRNRIPPLEPPEGIRPCQHLDFSLIKATWTLDLQSCKITNLCCFLSP